MKLSEKTRMIHTLLISLLEDYEDEKKESLLEKFYPFKDENIDLDQLARGFWRLTHNLEKVDE
ncbi:hypothetical protein [Gottfriedia solisilvae]|uniref:hypothetical protein n=1 Tax=Gottfriedia solisilvae TaxID=1516104 RepID=UPI003D2F4D58